MRTRTLLACLLLVAGPLPQGVFAHGGAYLGPSDSVPPPGPPTGPTGTKPAAPPVGVTAVPSQPGGAAVAPGVPGVGSAASEPDSSVW